MILFVRTMVTTAVNPNPNKMNGQHKKHLIDLFTHVSPKSILMTITPTYQFSDGKAILYNVAIINAGRGCRSRV